MNAQFEYKLLNAIRDAEMFNKPIEMSAAEFKQIMAYIDSLRERVLDEGQCPDCHTLVQSYAIIQVGFQYVIIRQCPECKALWDVISGSRGFRQDEKGEVVEWMLSKL